jgi:hypothetical protein
MPELCRAVTIVLHENFSYPPACFSPSLQWSQVSGRPEKVLFCGGANQIIAPNNWSNYCPNREREADLDPR